MAEFHRSRDALRDGRAGVSGGSLLDLVALVPGKDDREVLEGLFSARVRDLEIREILREILVHPRRDPGCFREAEDVLRPYHRRARHALVMFDHEGCGREDHDPAVIAAEVEKRLAASGWRDRVAVVVIVPELEAWIWRNALAVATALRWSDQHSLREWLADAGLWPPDADKPPDPRRALERALRHANQRRSSAVYRQLAERIPIEGCLDSAFRRLSRQLREWFPDRSAQG